MAGFGKWLAGGLGLVLGGPIGAVIGFALGSMFEAAAPQAHVRALTTAPRATLPKVILK